ncbi:MarR family transcriptional regulator [Tsukamurella strandjordii]|uniref:MarR family winged helix-turn-helix transcriptional regulator n=1 Tax=Tsukamurella strandjordii TaxID=147577 RepID=UPI0031D15A4C
MTTSPHDDQAQSIALACVRFARTLRGRRPDAGVTLAQLATLNALAEDGPLTPGQLADRERVTPPTISRVIASLYDLELVDRGPHPTDGRQVIVSINDAGRQIINDENSARRAWLHQQLRSLTDHERDALAEAATILERLHGTSD